MRLRQRLPYIVVLAVAAAAEIATGVIRLAAGQGWFFVGAPLALGVPLGAAALLLYLHKPSPFVPFWARPFEVLKTHRGVVVRCTGCDDLVVVGSSAPLPVPRILNYAHGHHDSAACRDRQRAAAARRLAFGETSSGPLPSAPLSAAADILAEAARLRKPVDTSELRRAEGGDGGQARG